MSPYDLQILDTLETTDYMKGELASEDLSIPTHMVPPDPDDSDILPSQAHPSYPYGNPTNPKHPASRPRPPYDPSSRALFEDMGYDGGGINGSLRWRDLATAHLLPVDAEKEEARRATEARKMASGASNAAASQAGIGQDETVEEEDEDENDENENENDEEDEEDEETEGEEEEEEG
ncbi:hypothetical protein C8R45DRAFT_827311 [Mycena sanguinolenta]|nr:hypothetical protein C8R45DRAFT_827311 [Mycena sanguinolenta]